MSIFDFFKKVSFDEKLEEARQNPLAALLDVRTPEEYKEGHVPGSINLPLQQIKRAGTLLKKKDIPVYVYCRSGARSRQAAEHLRMMGYEKITNLGGIMDYKGKVVR